NESEGGDNGKPIDPSAKPVVKALKVKGPLEVGKDLTGTYQFDANNGNGTDKSTFAWGEKGKTDAAKGETVAQSGTVPAHTIVAADAGKVLEVGVQAKNGANVVGNTAKVATDGSMSENEGGGNETEGGDNGKPLDPSAKPVVKALKVKGLLEVDQDLTAAYQFDANNGNGTDKSTFAWGEKGKTDAAKGETVAQSGVVPAYKIVPPDAGKVLEVAVQAKNGANAVGNTAKVATDGSMSENDGGGNETEGGDNGKPLNPLAPPVVKALKVKGTLEVGKDLTGEYQFDANNGDRTDASTYAWGVKSTIEPAKGKRVVKSGEVPAYTISADDAGLVLEVGVQARNGASKVGNTVMAATDGTLTDNPDGGNETEGGENGKPIDPTAKPEVSALKLKGQLEVGKDLTGSYQFAAHGGNSTDKSTFAWGEKGKTDAAKGETVTKSGEVNAHKIVAADAGKVLELAIQAKNGAGTVGNTAKLATDGPANDGNGGGNESEGGDNGKPIDPSAKPVVKALKVKGPLEVGKDLTGTY
ncbi:hypothetical protein, partial [Chromobacterium sp. ASV23]|uniref:hypothetical protein n=1 Tax=Chromobacterium sp. ASV23 TaxID=2795110 RepID=UPI0018ECA271